MRNYRIAGHVKPNDWYEFYACDSLGELLTVLRSLDGAPYVRDWDLYVDDEKTYSNRDCLDLIIAIREFLTNGVSSNPLYQEMIGVLR